MKKLLLTNTLTKKREEFVPLRENEVLLYGCGVTPYDDSHIGHGRSYVFIDILVRYLRFCGYNVTYVRNVTDIDDKLIKKAAAGDQDYKEIAEHFTQLYQQEMAALNNVDPDAEPKVTENIGKIIGFIEQLINAGHAYVIDEDVYFEVATYQGYGELSGRKVEDLIAGARVQVDERKKHPADFALWKGNNEKLFWESPWGYGRPGWHIECSVLAKAHLSESIDIHCGGMDLIFPHHENERAQSESLHGKVFTRYWVHNALLTINKEKMSKSVGNILSLKEIFEKYDPMVVRFYFLQHHYRTPIEFSFDMLDAAAVAYKKISSVLGPIDGDLEGGITDNDIAAYDCLQKMVDALAEDLNTPKVIGILFENLSVIRDDSTGKLARSIKKLFQQVLGLRLDPIAQKEITPEVESLIKQRQKARDEKNWGLADKIRDQLVELGYSIQDKKL